MVAASEIISKPKSRQRFLRLGLRKFCDGITERRAAIRCPSNSQLLTSNSSLSYDYKRLLCETDAVGGAISQTYASDTTEEFGDLIGEDGQYIHQYDAQANTNALLDETGTVQAQYKYFAFGQVNAVSINGGSWTAEDWSRRAGMPLDFTSNMLAGGKKQYYLDQEIALYLLGGGNNGRYYDAATGRFLSEDPTGDAGGDDNLLRYTGNDPVNNLDPSGHKHHKPYQSPQTQQGQQHRSLKTAEGKFIDPNTGEVIEGKYDLGHKAGSEFKTEKAKATAEGLTQREFNKRMNNPDLCQIEKPSSNRSHRFERKD